MGLLTWLGLSIREDTGTMPAGVTPPARSSDSLTNDAALSLGNVYRAVQILSVAASQLTMDVSRGRDVLPTPSVVSRPDVNSTLGAWLAMTVNSLAITGNAYWRVIRDDRGPRNVEALDPHVCYPNEDGTLSYKGLTLEANEFRHLALLRRAGRTLGLGPIQAARAELGGALDLRDYAAGWMRSGDIPTGVLTSEQNLNAEQAERYKDRWENRDKYGVAVLGNGLTYNPVAIKPEDAQFIENRQFTKTEIASLFGIPAHLMLAAVEGSSMTYTNIASADLTFVRWTLMAYLREIEEAMSAILPGQQTARFNLDAITRPDISTRYKAHKIALDAGWMDVDEVRAIEGLPPRDAPEGIAS